MAETERERERDFVQNGLLPLFIQWHGVKRARCSSRRLITRVLDSRLGKGSGVPRGLREAQFSAGSAGLACQGVLLGCKKVWH